MCLLLLLSPMVFYLIPATLVFLTALHTFLEDESTPKTHLDSWVMLSVASMLWPITLPAITSHLVREASRNDKANYATSRALISLAEK
jgi:hypothetical protein